MSVVYHTVGRKSKAIGFAVHLHHSSWRRISARGSTGVSHLMEGCNTKGGGGRL